MRKKINYTPLLEARKVLTDRIAGFNFEYRDIEHNLTEIRKEIKQIDDLIKSLETK